MLSRRIRPTLCQSCRNDLLLLFENGLGLASALRVPQCRIQWSSPNLLLRPKRATRSFRSKHGLHNSSEGPESPPDAASSDADTIDQMYRARLEAIKQGSAVPDVGDVDEDDSEWAPERLDEIAHRLWEMENGGEGKCPEAAPQAAESLQYNLEQYRQGLEALHKHNSEPMNEMPQESGLLESDMDVGDSDVSEQGNVKNQTEFRSRVEALRDLDASAEEVAREARQIHGEYLPEGVLSEEESKTYKRLYGDPLEGEEVEDETLTDDAVSEQQELLHKGGDSIIQDETGYKSGQEEMSSVPTSGEAQIENADFIDQRMMEVAGQIGGEIRQYEIEQDTQEIATERGHPLTVAGRFETSPRTIFLPQESFIQPIRKILSEFSNKHIKEMSERLFGGRGLPDSPLTPRVGRILPQKPIPLDASQHGMGPMEANAYVSAVWPSTYAAITSVLVETRKRLGSRWLRGLLSKDGGASVLDAGGGGVGVLAWRDIITAEWESLHSSDASPPPAPLGKSTVLIGADNLRYRAASLLENTTFLPRLPDYVHVRDSATLSDDRPAPQRKQFDVIFAPHTLWSLREEWQRKQQVQNLWSLLNPDGGVLLLVEKGVPRGFEVIAGARELLLSRYIATADSPSYESELESSGEVGTVQKGKGMIVAPCTNHAPCPMYPVPGVSRGRKDFCSFQQRYIRPSFLQLILGAKDRNHDDADFSYVAVRKGRDLHDASSTSEPVVQDKDATNLAFEGYEDATEPEETSKVHSLTLPRLVFPPLKRPGHVTVDLCTPAGKIDRWTISKSFSKTAYRDARKASWGDLWALGAKTRVPRNLQLGGERSKKCKSQDERMMSKARSVLDRMEEDKQADREVQAEMETGETEAEADETLSDDDDIDVDAVEVLKKIEQEDSQRKADAFAQRQQQHQKRKEASWTPEPRKQSGETSQSQPGHSELPKRSTRSPKNITTNRQDVSASASSSTESNPSHSHLTPEELAQMRDFASESRVDHLKSMSGKSMSRNSAKLRMQRGENKFREPEKERWRAKLESKMAKKRDEKRAKEMAARTRRRR
jgi:ribosomal protein RSM22 (predicted rRNA methylase)